MPALRSDARLRWFGPDDREAMHAALEVHNAVLATDSPWQRPELPGRYEAFLRHGWDGEPATPYLLRVDGQAVGVGSVSLTERDNTHLAWLSVAVHPDHRRRGHGRTLMEHLLREARAAGRTVVGTDGWDAEPVRAFAAAFGMEERSRALQRRQHLDDFAAA